MTILPHFSFFSLLKPGILDSLSKILLFVQHYRCAGHFTSKLEMMGPCHEELKENLSAISSRLHPHAEETRI